MSRLSVFSQGGIHIHPQSRNGSNVLEHAMVFMTWDVSATTAAAIKKHRLAGRSVALLIVQWDTSSGHHRQYNETRRLVNLNERRLSICFESPGTHRILALVVAGDSEGALHDKYLSSTSADYKTTVVTWDGFGVHDDVMEDTSATGCVDVEVPEGLFAKTPPDIWWLTRLIKTPPRDTCALPWRRIFAYFPLFQPLIIFVLLVCFVVVGLLSLAFSIASIVLLLSVGCRGINYLEPLKHPLNLGPKAVRRGVTGSIFVPKWRGFYIPLPLVVSPLALVLYGLLWWLTSGSETSGTLTSYGTTLGTIVFYTVLALIGATLTFAITTNTSQKERQQQRREVEMARREAVVESELSGITTVCMPDDLRLRPSMQTFRFLAARLKQRTCKFYPKK